ncbi:MAG: methyltransferase [bacterium]|nr:methyltransferase [bacterium]
MENSNPTNQKDGVNVVVKPPILFLAFLALGIVLRFMVKLTILSESRVDYGYFAGGLLILSGVSLIIWSVKTFKKFGETPHHGKPIHKIIASGPFKFTRNPMYLSMTSIYIGLSMIINTYWLLLFLPIMLIILHYRVILREEKYLEKKLKKEYVPYKSQVRRCI